MRNPKNPDDPDDCYWSPYWGLVPPPFVALQHHGSYRGYRRHVADGAGRPSLTTQNRLEAGAES
jgi:hypothetical protein